MTTQVMPFRARKSLWKIIFGRPQDRVAMDQQEAKRRARAALADLPDYLKRDIGLYD
jgi:uncharacterized protein YjiS (DUF1127 family)